MKQSSWVEKMETETISAREIRQVTLLPEYCGREVSYELLSKQPIYLSDSLVKV